jgi:hypothetical protein
MLNHNLDPDTGGTAAVAPRTVASPQADQPEGRVSPEQWLAPLSPAMAHWHRRPHHEGSQVIVRFHNGYGALISEYRLPLGIYEIAPLRFHGPGPDDHELYFRSHVPDLTWCSADEDMLAVCQEIAGLLPPRQV